MLRLISLLAVCLLLVPASAQDKPGSAVTPKVDPGWTSLFNGKDLAGWTPKIKGYELGENFGNTFRVEDGVLKVAYDKYEKFDRRFGHLFYAHEYSHYLFRLEYRFTGAQVPGGPGWAFRNSGVMIHGQPAGTMKKGQDFPVCIEVQLLGGRGKGKRTTGNLCTPGTNVEMKGKLVRRHCIDSTSETYHGDQWVSLEIEVRGSDLVRHKIGGKVVLEYTKPQLDDRDGNAKGFIEKRKGEKLLSKGTISLQSESHGCEFRNIRIKVLDPK